MGDEWRKLGGDPATVWPRKATVALSEAETEATRHGDATPPHGIRTSDTGQIRWHPTDPVPDRWGHAAGRHYVTALHLLMLEVYYRHLPLFEELVK